MLARPELPCPVGGSGATKLTTWLLLGRRLQIRGRGPRLKPKSCSRLFSSGLPRPPSTLRSNAAAISSLQRRLQAGVVRRGGGAGFKLLQLPPDAGATQQAAAPHVKTVAAALMSSSCRTQAMQRMPGSGMAYTPAKPRQATRVHRLQESCGSRKSFRLGTRPALLWDWPESGHGGWIPHMGEQGLQVCAQRGKGRLCRQLENGDVRVHHAALRQRLQPHRHEACRRGPGGVGYGGVGPSAVWLGGGTREAARKRWLLFSWCHTAKITCTAVKPPPAVHICRLLPPAAQCPAAPSNSCTASTWHPSQRRKGAAARRCVHTRRRPTLRIIESCPPFSRPPSFS